MSQARRHGTVWDRGGPGHEHVDFSYLDEAEAGHSAALVPAPAFAFIEPDVTIPTTNLVPPPLRAGWVLDGNVSWSASITYTDHGRNDPSPTFSGTSAVWSPLAIDFQGIVQGGTIQFTIDADIKDSATGAKDHTKLTATNKILGQNPAPSAIKARLGDIVSQVIGFIESSFRQFDSGGLPLFGGPVSGFGVMQLDNAPTPTARDLWDWQQNVDEGKGKYSAGQGTVRQHFKNLRDAHPSLPELTADQLKLADYEFYNAGSQDYYWVPNAGFTDWSKNPNTNLTQYGDKAVAIEFQVVAGNPPAGW